MQRIVMLFALTAIVGGFAATSAGAQDQEPLPPGVPDWKWQQVITGPATVWTCKTRVQRRGKTLWRVNLLARSKETQYQVGASARLVRHPRKKTLDDWDSGTLDPGERSKVGRVVGDVDNNDRLTIGAGHRSGPNKGAGLGDTITIREIGRC